jgi:hypothetical protein
MKAVDVVVREPVLEHRPGVLGVQIPRAVVAVPVGPPHVQPEMIPPEAFGPEHTHG